VSSFQEKGKRKEIISKMIMCADLCKTVYIQGKIVFSVLGTLKIIKNISLKLPHMLYLLAF
jgi:hypothetical protein